MDNTYLKKRCNEAKIKCLEICVNAGAGHVTSAFSCAELVTALYYDIMKHDPQNPQCVGRDRFIMSKNHGSVMTFPILADLGYIDEKEIYTFLKNGSRLGMHSKMGVPGIDFSGGSLGIGLGIACGMAYSAKHNNYDWLTFCIVGDGEMYEGSIWESAMFAGANKLDNLIVIIDRNHMAITDYTDNMLSQNPLEDKWRSFNFEVRKIDGHSFEEIKSSLSDIRTRKSNKPLCVIAETVKGNGVSFLENNIFMHGCAPKGEKANLAKQELLISH